MRRMLSGLAAVAVSVAACTNTPQVVGPSQSPLPAPTTAVSDLAPSRSDATTTETTTTTNREDDSTAASSSSTTESAAGTSATADDGVSTPEETEAVDEVDGAPDPTAPTGPDPRLVGSYTVEVVATAPHDPTAYTQGLELHNGRLLESTGKRESSDRRWVDPRSGDVIQTQVVGSNLFAEGLTVVGNEAYQLTYQAELLIVFDLDTLAEQRVLQYEGEGWGLCHDGNELAMSNGSDVLTFRDPVTFEITRQTPVRLNGDGVGRLNELECANGQVLANVYGLDQIIAIDPATGEVEAVIDASALRPTGAPADDYNYVLNGIAHNPNSETFFLTGKWWPTLFEVRFVAV